MSEETEGERWPIGADMGTQKRCVTHKVVQPWAAGADRRERPTCEALTDHGGSASRTSHPGVKPLPTTPPTQEDGRQLPMADDGKRGDDDDSTSLNKSLVSDIEEGQDARGFFPGVDDH